MLSGREAKVDVAREQYKLISYYDIKFERCLLFSLSYKEVLDRTNFYLSK